MSLYLKKEPNIWPLKVLTFFSFLTFYVLISTWNLQTNDQIVDQCAYIPRVRALRLRCTHERAEPAMSVKIPVWYGQPITRIKPDKRVQWELSSEPKNVAELLMEAKCAFFQHRLHDWHFGFHRARLSINFPRPFILRISPTALFILRLRQFSTHHSPLHFPWSPHSSLHFPWQIFQFRVRVTPKTICVRSQFRSQMHPSIGRRCQINVKVKLAFVSRKNITSKFWCPTSPGNVIV